MSKLETFEQFVSSQTVRVSLPGLVLHLLVGVVLSLVLAEVYVRWGQSLSNRRRFAATFTTLVLTTTLIITIVRSSLALSLAPVYRVTMDSE